MYMSKQDIKKRRQCQINGVDQLTESARFYLKIFFNSMLVISNKQISQGVLSSLFIWSA